MDTSVVALMISGASLAITMANYRHTQKMFRISTDEKEKAIEAQWSLYIDPDWRDVTSRQRRAVISFVQSGICPAEIVELRPVLPSGVVLLPGIAVPISFEAPDNMIPGMKTMSGSLLSVDVRKSGDDRYPTHTDFDFYVQVPERPSDDRSLSTRVSIVLVFEEVMASRRQREIVLSSNMIAWRKFTTDKAI